ncbi:MAG TPA: DUF1800 domain-containing protein [Candidatus Obscuribacterales bacterium]
MTGRKSESFWISHLLRRAGFGTTPQELRYYTDLGYDKTVDELLDPQSVNNDALEQQIRQQDFDFTLTDDLKRWWLYRMAFTRRPLEEKMTLFWHGHFATSDRKVNNAYAMYGQNQLFRKLALGNFHELLFSVSKDPAMIVWLDNQQNRKGKPNENYAREIMELFTLGAFNGYTEKDIKEAARAFTGWQTHPDGFYFNKNQHDEGEKTVLGVTGNLNGDDVIDILVKQPAAPKFLSRKLVKFFVLDVPDEGLVNRIADVYIHSNYSIKQMMQALLTDKAFLSEKAFHAKIKSPAELVVGTIKTLQVTTLDADLPATMARMGQDLLMPPTVKGWDGGQAWISTGTMMERFNFANRMTSEKFADLHKYMSPSQMLQKQGLANAGQAVDYFLDLLVDADVPANTRQKLVDYLSSDLKGNAIGNIPDDQTLDAKLRGLVHLIMTLPTYQLA